MIQSEYEETRRRKKTFGWIINQVKDYLQNLCIAAWLKNKGRGVINCYTGFGKGHLARKVIRKFLAKYPNEKVIVVVPSDILFKQWKVTCEEFGDSVIIYGIKTYTMSLTNVVKECGLLIVDEVHHAAGSDAQYYNTVFGITKAKYMLGMTATLSAPQENYLKSKYGIGVVWEITLDEGNALGIIPEHLLCNIGVNLSDGEQATYYQVSKNYDYYLSKFSCIDQDNAWAIGKECMVYSTGLTKRLEVVQLYKEFGIGEPTEKEVYKWASQFWKAQNARNAVIYSSYEKHRLMQYLLQNINRNIVVFTTTTKVLHWWQSDRTTEYHSKLTPSQKRKSLASFPKEHNIILSCQALVEGYDNDQIEVAVLHDYTSNNKDYEQIVGRTLRPNKSNLNKFAVAIAMYCKPFSYTTYVNNKPTTIDIVPQDYKRLKNAQKRMTNVEEITLTELMERI